MKVRARAAWYSRAQILAVAGILLLVPLVSGAVEGAPKVAKGEAPAEACAMLDDVELRGRMDGLLLKLIIMCDRQDLLGLVPPEPASEPGPGEPDAGGVDIPVNNPAGDTGSTTHTQSETSMTRNEVTGTICSGYNDSYHGVTQGTGYAGFSRSTDGGATFTDRGGLNSSSCYGDPSIVWRRSDGYFYYATIYGSGLAIWRSTDDCNTFIYLGLIHNGSSDDKELMTVDNNPASPYYGRLYVVWTDFGAGQVIRSTYSDNGTNWSSPVTLNSGSGPQGAWPVVAPNGDVYVSWANGLFTGTMNIAVARSANGGAAYSLVTSPAANKTEPRDAAASSSCGRPSLRGNIRYLPSPQIAVGPDGAVHVVYSYDPDGYNTGDVIDAFYRRSTDSGATWGPEVRLNTDATTRDQFFPTISIGAGNIVSTTWYDRREDPGNTLFKYYQRFSFDGGVNWEPDEAISDVASPVYIDPQLAYCYHGDYDTHVQTGTHAIAQWSDDRYQQSGHNDPDVFADRLPISTDFLLLPQTTSLAVCSPDSAVVTIDVPQFSGFSQPVTMSTGALPPGLVAGFVPNPVTPPSSTVLTLSGTGGVAAGSYDILVVGTASPSGIVHDTTITLDVFTSAPGAISLLTPANGALNQPLRPAFTWSAATQAASYTLEVDDDPAFGSPALLESGITETTFTPSTDLASNTTYYWRVTAENLCGTGAVSTVYSFTTEALPGDCGVGTIPLVAFTEDFESGAAGWTHSGTGDSWALSGARVHGGAFSYHANGTGTTTDQRLVSPEMTLPTEVPVTMQFWNWQTMESAGAGSCYDGGILEISTDGGSNWTYLPTAVMQTDPYDGPVSGLGSLEGWCGDPQDWLRSVVDLDAYAGQTVRFRYRLGTDGSVSREGWYVDDMHVQSCVPAAPDFYLGATPGSATICAGDSADYTVNVGAYSGFSNPVTLAASGNPSGTTAGFVPNPVTPPGSSLLTIGNTGGVAGGSYGITINGTASGSGGHSTGVTLNVVVPAAVPTLTAPANGAVNQPLRPVFQWSAAAGATSYGLEVDDDPAFGSPAIAVTGIAGTTYTPTTDLDDATVYYWRVRSENLCGPGGLSTVFSFTTVSLLPFSDGFESGDTSAWSTTVP
ncbi:MAG: hypothetical protein C3F15_00180 [Holophagae bacterium]|nr:MAG: hypothetical protein C3F15_00180 [Holophagae bacterium]